MASVTYECPHGTILHEEQGETEGGPCILCFAQSIYEQATSRDDSPERDEMALNEIAEDCAKLLKDAGFDPKNPPDGEEEEEPE